MKKSKPQPQSTPDGHGHDRLFLRVYRTALFNPASCLFPYDTPFSAVIDVPPWETAPSQAAVRAITPHGYWTAVEMPYWSTRQPVDSRAENVRTTTFQRPSGCDPAVVWWWELPGSQWARTFGVAWTPVLNATPQHDNVSLLPYRFQTPAGGSLRWLEEFVRALGMHSPLVPGKGCNDHTGDWEVYDTILADTVLWYGEEAQEQGGSIKHQSNTPFNVEWPFVCVGSGL